MEAPTWEDIEISLYADSVYFEEVKQILEDKLYEAVMFSNLRMDNKSINIVKKICLNIMKKHPTKVDFKEDKNGLINIDIDFT